MITWNDDIYYAPRRKRQVDWQGWSVVALVVIWTIFIGLSL